LDLGQQFVEPLELPGPRRGDRDDVAPPVGRIGGAVDQFAVGEFSDHRHHVAAVDAVEQIRW
jgi:hypothetical protein